MPCYTDFAAFRVSLTAFAMTLKQTRACLNRNVESRRLMASQKASLSDLRRRTAPALKARQRPFGNSCFSLLAIVIQFYHAQTRRYTIRR